MTPVRINGGQVDLPRPREDREIGPAVPGRSPSLKRRHKVPGRGTRQFAPAVVFGELGVVRLTTPRRRGP